MGKNDGFMIYSRESNKVKAAAERICSFEEFRKPLDEEERRRQAARCMDCGVPMCQSAIKLKGMVTGCPLHNLIPEWNDALYGGYYETALDRLLVTSSFPEFTGRVCPALCEKACNCADIPPISCESAHTKNSQASSKEGEGAAKSESNAVSIHDNELFIIEKAFASGEMKPRIPLVRTDKKVAVIGAGPAGLAVADMLNRRGHNVDVYERDDMPGGLLMYGIPNMKLDKNIVARRVELMKAEGVKFECNADVGRGGENGGDTIDAAKIISSYDAVALCCGAKKARVLNVPGADASGVVMAVDFLKAVTKSLIHSGLKDGAFFDVKGKDVVIVGGGDTGNDCVGTAIRLGCASVKQIEMMPRPPKERAKNNPWPEWPKVLKTDYGQEEAIERFGEDPRTWSATVKEVLVKDGHVSSVVITDVEMKEVDGRRQAVNVEGSEREVPCGLLLIAAGFTGCEEYTANAFGTQIGGRGCIAVKDNSHATSVPGVFAAGDMMRGQSLVVWAIKEGRECAKEIDKYLMGYTNL